MLVAVGAIFILALPLSSLKWLSRLRSVYEWFSSRPVRAVLLCAVSPVMLRLLLLPFSPIPTPSIHDEFSHLLLADTLAHGRLTNPTPVMWRHFESIHVIQKPTYNSMYPPAQGIFLALGQVFFHQPWAGVELSIALMAAAMYWMFLAWMPRNWALFGVVLAILKLALVGFWVNSYMGGSVPAVGGALVVGALPRLKRESFKALHSFLFGLGAVILMNSRPLEGGVLTLAVLAFLLPNLQRIFRDGRFDLLKRLILPGATVFLVGAACLGVYCWRVTGHFTRMPYQVNRSTYGWPENLAILPPKRVNLQEPVLRNMYELEVSHHNIYKSIPGLVDNLVTRAFDNWAYLLGPVLTIPFFLPFFMWKPRARGLILILLVMGLLNLLQLLLYPYHLAPVIPVMFCLIAMGSQALFAQISRLGQGRGNYFAIVLPLLLVTVSGLKLFGDEIEIPPSSYWERGFEWHRDTRAAVTDWLGAIPGKQLVVVRYAENHPVNQEWVYNGADLDGSKILWARELDTASNLELLHYYSNRQAWLLEADVYPQRVVPYPMLANGSKRTDDCAPCAGVVRR